MSDASFDAAADFPEVAYETWRAQVEAELGETPFDEALVSRSREGLEIQPLYTARDLPASAENLGLPGCAPFARGTRLLGSSVAGWSVGHEIALEISGDLESADAAAETLRWAVERGAQTLWLRFAGTSRFGPEAFAAVDRLFAKVDLRTTAVVLEAGADAGRMAKLLLGVAERRGVTTSSGQVELRGSLGCDPFNAPAERSDAAFDTVFDATFADGLRLAAWAVERAPEMRSFLVSTSAWHDAGATPADELAFALASGVEVLRRATAAGLEIDAACGQILFATSLGRDLFLEIAKLRAARLLWSKVVAASGGSEAAGAMELHARTSAAEQSASDRWTNLLRGTAQAFSAIVGGASGLLTAPFDEPMGEPEQIGRRVAINLQHVLAEEGHLARVLDPAGGSWYLESLTDRLARTAWGTFQEIEDRGGMAACLRDGWVAKKIAEGKAV